ncbi:hypothetical protein [Joostella sp. CR20]|uniref:hypothetical protein n=1 Tax=Joostella sp. CR20 TaxID=2804312 RepID=UPI00313E3FB8
MAEEVKEGVKEVKKAKPKTSKHILKKNVGTTKDGKPKKKKGDTVYLSKDQEKNYKNAKLI